MRRVTAFFGGSLSLGKEKVLKHILRKRFTQDDIEGPSKFIFQNYEKFLFILLVSIFSIFMHYYKRMDHDSAMYLRISLLITLLNLTCYIAKLSSLSDNDSVI